MTVRNIHFSLPVLTPLKKWVSAMQASPGVIPYTLWTALNSKYRQRYLSVCVEDNAVGRFLAYKLFPQVFWIEGEYDPDAIFEDYNA